MTTEFIWRLPGSGDVRHGNAKARQRGETRSAALSPAVSDPRGDGYNYYDYLHQVARAAHLAGFDGIQIPNDPDGEESWILAGVVAPETRRLKLLTEFEASRGSAVYAAKNAVSFQRYTGGRFAWQIGAGGNDSQRRAFGDFVSSAEIPARIEEFVTVARGVLTQSPFTYKGKFFEVLNGGFQGPLANQAVPQVYLSGDDEASYRLSARLADVHVFDALPLDAIAAKVASLQSLATAVQRTVTAALRIDVLAREAEHEAFFDARRYLEQSGGRPGAIQAETGPLLWQGFSTDRTAAAATLIGSYQQVVDRLVDYANAGIDSFILAGLPHLEEAYRVGEHILPAVHERIGQHQRAA